MRTTPVRPIGFEATVAPVKALEFSRKEARYLAAAVSSRIRPGSGATTGPLALIEAEEIELPGPGWRRVTTRLAGICGSDLATVDGRSARYFEPWVSFPFIPGHEVVGRLADGSRVVLEPVIKVRIDILDVVRPKDWLALSWRLPAEIGSLMSLAKLGSAVRKARSRTSTKPRGLCMSVFSDPLSTKTK